jgi:antitoxin HicB
MARTEETVLAWPAKLSADDEGRVQVRFPDFPEAVTDGASEREALVEAADCLAEAVAARIADGEDIPAPTPLRRRIHTIPLPPLLAYKAAVFRAMQRDGISKSELARRLKVDEKDVRRLIDPRYHGSKVERLHAALAACGVVAQITLVESAQRERLLGSAARSGRGSLRQAAAVVGRRAG